MLCIDWTMFKLASYLWVRLFLSCYPRKGTINGWNMFYWQFTDIQQKFRTHFNSLLSILNDWLQCAYLCNCNNMYKKLLIRFFFLVPLKICFQKHNSSRKQKLETRFIIINTKLWIILISYIKQLCISVFVAYLTITGMPSLVKRESRKKINIVSKQVQ